MGDEDRFPYWRKDDYVQNFGDYLTELFLEALFETELRDAGAPGEDTVVLVGSLIATWYIEMIGRRRPDSGLVFWCCGMRDEAKLTAEAMARCRFPAVRGPLTRDLLGLAEGTPVGDSGLLLPLLHRPAMLERYRGRVLCVPHIADPLSDTALLRRTGADCVLRPGIAKSLAALRDTIDAIASAKFVLAGAMHAAVCACAYGVPFALLDTGHVDLPFKWRDFAASVGLEAAFARDADEGRALWRDQTQERLRLPKLVPLLEAAPLPVRAEVLARAVAHDG